jgi:hypothetical protein
MPMKWITDNKGRLSALWYDRLSISRAPDYLAEDLCAQPMRVTGPLAKFVTSFTAGSKDFANTHRPFVPAPRSPGEPERRRHRIVPYVAALHAGGS